MSDGLPRERLMNCRGIGEEPTALVAGALAKGRGGRSSACLHRLCSASAIPQRAGVTRVVITAVVLALVVAETMKVEL